MVGILFCDLDGVLADCGHRLHFVDEGDKDRFYSKEEILKDRPIAEGLELIRMFRDNGYRVVFISSRRESCREATTEWLSRIDEDLANCEMHLKPSGDEREAWEVKEDLLADATLVNHELFSLGSTHYFLDDYSKNCEMVRDVYKGTITPINFCRKMRQNTTIMI